MKYIEHLIPRWVSWWRVFTPLYSSAHPLPSTFTSLDGLKARHQNFSIWRPQGWIKNRRLQQNTDLQIRQIWGKKNLIFKIITERDIDDHPNLGVKKRKINFLLRINNALKSCYKLWSCLIIQKNSIFF